MPSAQKRFTESEQSQAERWDYLCEGWARWRDEFESAAQVVSSHLADIAELKPGDYVLDVGTGLGEPAVTAHNHVTPGGSVLAVDVSPQMISRARRLAGERDGLRFEVGSANSPGVPFVLPTFSAILSRWSLSFTEDPLATSTQLTRRLRPGGRMAVAAWSTPDRVPMISLGFSIIADRLGLSSSAANLPGPFALSDPRALRTIMARSGLHDVQVEEVEVPFQLPTARDYARFTMDVLPSNLQELVNESGEAASILEAVRSRTAEFRVPGSDKLDLTSTAICASGVK